MLVLTKEVEDLREAWFMQISRLYHSTGTHRYRVVVNDLSLEISGWKLLTRNYTIAVHNFCIVELSG